MGFLLFWKRKKAAPASPPLLQTSRLVLRGFRPSDALDVFAYAKNPNVGPMAGWAPHRSIEDSREQVLRFMERGDVWAIVEKRTGIVIGSIGLHRDRKRSSDQARMVGYALGEPWWGQGYATEAASELVRHAFESENASLVSAYHYSFNSKSKRVIKKLGMTYEGTLRLASIHPDGSLCDDCCYSITRSEYAALLASPKSCFGASSENKKV